MNLKRATTTLPAIIATALLPVAAHAHPGHAAAEIGSIASGVAHPFTGLDHLLLALALGIWIALSKNALRTWLPASALAGGVAGALGGNLLGAFGGLELGVTASVLAIACIILRDLRMSPVLSYTLAALCAAFHGWAHGAEVPASYLGGVLLGTAFISVLGFGLGHLFARSHSPAACKASV